MKVQPDLARFIDTIRGGLKESRRPVFSIVLTIVSLAFSVSIDANGLDDLKGEAVIHTDDGQIVAGWVKSSSNDKLQLDTKFGDLLIQWDDVLRVNGESYSQEEGIVREHRVELRADGSAKVEALVPVSLRTGEKKTAFLVVGRVLQVLDLDDRPLGFASTMRGDFSRCMVDALPYRVPAFQVTTVVPEAAEVQHGLLRYQFDYTPRVSQLFHFQIGLPVGATILAATPMPSKTSDEELQWRIDALSQRLLKFHVDLKLDAN